MQSKAEIEDKIKAAFKELVLSQPVDKITIKEITDKAGLIRTTFYHHYQDKYELMEMIVQKEVIDPIAPLLENDMIDEAMVLIFSNLMHEKDFYMRLAKTSGQNSFEQIAEKCVKEILLKIIGSKLQARLEINEFKHKWVSPEIVSVYYSRTIVFAVMFWIDQGMPYTPREMAGIYDYIISHSLQNVVDELKDQTL